MQKRLYSQNLKTQNNNCPTCGFHISHSASFEQVLAGQFDNDRDGSYYAIRTTPVRASTIEADVLVPAAQSLLWSIFAALPAIPVSFWLRYEWYFPVAVASVSALVSWISAMRRSENSQSKVEEFHYDAQSTSAGKNPANQARPGVEMTLIDKTQKNAESWKIVDLPPGVTQAKLSSFFVGVMSGRGLSRKEWTPERKHFSRDQYDQIIAGLLAGNIIIDVPGRGKRLTEIGKHAIGGYVATLENGGKNVQI